MPKKFLRVLPIVAMFGIALAIILTNKDISVSKLISYTPENKLMAALFLIALYTVKSFTLILPIDVLSTVGGIMFSGFWGSVINIAGVAISISVAYWTGRFSGAELSERLSEKYPKIKKLKNAKKNNEFFFSFIVRALGILPCDIVGMYMGSLKLDFKKYLLGGLLGFSPSIILVTLFGAYLDSPKSPFLYIILAFNLIFSGISATLYKFIRKRKKNNEKA